MSAVYHHHQTLQIPVSQAVELGLEEACMLSILGELLRYRDGIAHNGYLWLEVGEALVTKHMPFWNEHDVQRICKSLVDKGQILLASAPYTSSRVIQFAFNQPASASGAAPARHQLAHNQVSPGANRIAPNWQPSDDVLAHIAQHNIPAHFVREQLGAFITYWRERGDIKASWGNEFIKYVLREWRYHETSSARQQHQERDRHARWEIQAERATPMTPNWRPSADAMELLVVQAGINRAFVEDAIAEFIIYWQDKGTVMSTWNSAFIKHVRHQWARHQNAVENDSEPRTLPANWQPSESALDVLRMANIDIDFALQLLPEFVLYWHESKQMQVSWNSKFLQFIKQRWAQNHNLANRQGGSTQGSGQTRERSLADDLTDRSWATP